MPIEHRLKTQMQKTSLLKQQLRAEALAERLHAPPTSTEIAGVHEALAACLAAVRPTTVFAYVPVRYEIDILSTLEGAALPRVHGPGLMEFYQWRQGDELERGPFGIPAPESKVLMIPDNRTILLIPALRVDRRGFRLGYGGGYYDRYCARYPTAQRALITLSRWTVDVLPDEPSDLVNEIIIDETGWRKLEK
jgi:5-formyltetrahydrofolate cyclo-ligase